MACYGLKEIPLHEEKSEYGKSTTQKIGLILGPVLFLIVLLFFNFDPENSLLTRMAAVAVLMAVWWITDAIPLFATALLPMLLFPLLGTDLVPSQCSYGWLPNAACSLSPLCILRSRDRRFEMDILGDSPVAGEGISADENGNRAVDSINSNRPSSG